MSNSPIRSARYAGAVGLGALLGVAVVALPACRDPSLLPIASEETPPAHDGTGDGTPPTPNPTPEPLSRVTRPNPIPKENALPGDADWREGTRARARELELYTTHESLRHGERLGIKASSDVAVDVTAEIFRIGWYGGKGARKVWSGGPFSIAPQAECPRTDRTGLVECQWETTFEVPVSPDWVSGLYVVKLRRPDGFKRFSPFVLRDDRAAEILYTPNVTTWQAYNDWGGQSLYSDGSGKMPSGRSWQVSFDRPYASLDGEGKTFHLDLALVQFLERHGYDVTFATGLDFLRHPDLLHGIGALVHGGQDEYWFAEQRAQVDEALASGALSLAYFGGNGAYWRTRAAPSAAGPWRQLHCYKSEPLEDPWPHATVRFRDDPHAHPENNLFGVMYEGWQHVGFPLAVHDGDHWLFHGTGLQTGDLLTGLVGFEYDRSFPDHDGYPQGVRVSLESPVVTAEGVPSRAQAVDRTLPSGRLVFAAGTIWWPLGLSSDPATRDGRVERMTRNVLERALSHRRPERVVPPAGALRPEPPQVLGEWAQEVSWFAGDEGQAGLLDGPLRGSRFDGPTGLAVTPEGDLLVADTRNNRVRLVTAEAPRQVLTLAGTGERGHRDGDGAQAQFRDPIGVAVGIEGEIYVADSDNHVIRRLDRKPGGGGWTVSTVAGQPFAAGFADGAADTARFNRPVSLAVHPDGHVFVADQANHRLRKIVFGTGEVKTVAGTGVQGWRDAARGVEAELSNPSAVAVAKDGTAFVLDASSQRIRRVRPQADYEVDTVAGDPVAWTAVGYRDGTGEGARFRAQLGLVVEPSGALLLADTANFRIRRIVPGETATTTRVTTVAGDGRLGTARGWGHQANVVSPTGLALDADGHLYVSEPFHHGLLRVTFGR